MERRVRRLSIGRGFGVDDGLKRVLNGPRRSVTSLFCLITYIKRSVMNVSSSIGSFLDRKAEFLDASADRVGYSTKCTRTHAVLGIALDVLVLSSLVSNVVYSIASRSRKRAVESSKLSVRRGRPKDGATRKLFVTGGLGFVGSRIVKALVQDPEVDVAVFDVREPTPDEVDPSVVRIRFFDGSLLLHAHFFTPRPTLLDR